MIICEFRYDNMLGIIIKFHWIYNALRPFLSLKIGVFNPLLFLYFSIFLFLFLFPRYRKLIYKSISRERWVEGHQATVLQWSQGVDKGYCNGRIGIIIPTIHPSTLHVLLYCINQVPVVRKAKGKASDGEEAVQSKLTVAILNVVLLDVVNVVVPTMYSISCHVAPLL